MVQAVCRSEQGLERLTKKPWRHRSARGQRPREPGGASRETMAGLGGDKLPNWEDRANEHPKKECLFAGDQEADQRKLAGEQG